MIKFIENIFVPQTRHNQTCMTINDGKKVDGHKLTKINLVRKI